MKYEHKELASGRWKKLSFVEQMANTGSEVERAINWKNKNNLEYSQKAFNRALELLDITIENNKNNHPRLKELLRTRETLADYFMGDNNYSSSDEKWRRYFFAFALAARINK